MGDSSPQDAMSRIDQRFLGSGDDKIVCDDVDMCGVFYAQGRGLLNHLYAWLLKKPLLLRLLYLWLLFLTLIATLLGNEPFVPLNSITGSEAEGVHLAFPLLGSILEPLAALLHVILTFPNYREGIAVFAAWLVLAAWLLAVLGKKGLEPKLYRRRLWLWPLRVFGFFLLYVLFALVVPLPSWSLQSDDQGIVVADLHSHSMISNDGVISARRNLEVHQRLGFNLVAFTDHPNRQGAFAGYKLVPPSAGLPVALPGMEVPPRLGDGVWISAVGMDPQVHLPDRIVWKGVERYAEPYPSGRLWRVEDLVREVHRHGGVLIAVALHFTPELIHHMAEAGVDAFEYVNFGHPPLSKEVRRALILAQKQYGVSLVASNDWHGWTASLGSWTLLRSGDVVASKNPAAALDLIRTHQYERVEPVVVYPFYRMTAVETVMMPWRGIYLYAKTISWSQLMSWWLWVMLLSWCYHRGYCQRPGYIAVQVVLLVMALGFGDAGITLLADWLSSLNRPMLALKVAVGSLLIGLMLLLYSGWQWVSSRKAC